MRESMIPNLKASGTALTSPLGHAARHPSRSDGQRRQFHTEIECT
jgi:hypothetical protein